MPMYGILWDELAFGLTQRLGLLVSSIRKVIMYWREKKEIHKIKVSGREFPDTFILCISFFLDRRVGASPGVRPRALPAPWIIRARGRTPGDAPTLLPFLFRA